MSNIDDSGLFHADYDPAKAREYYLRTRKLKGRKPGSAKLSSTDKSNNEDSSRREARGKKGTPTSKRKPRKSAEQKRRESEAKVKALKTRLAKLKSLLAKLVAEAKGRSGVEPKEDPKKNAGSSKETPKEKADRNASEKSRKPLTAKQKAEARKRSKENYEENKVTKKDSDSGTSQEIEKVQAQIKQVRAQLKKAIASAKKDTKGRASGKDSLDDIDKVLDQVFSDLGVK